MITGTNKRKLIISIAVIIAVIAAFSHVFIKRPSILDEIRAINKENKIEKEKARDKILTLLNTHIQQQPSNSDFVIEAKGLLSTYNQKAETHSKSLAYLKQVRADASVRGFRHFNAFLSGIGLPIFIFCMAFLMFIISSFLKKENYTSLYKSVRLMSQVSFITSFIYLYWALFPSEDLSHSTYFIGLIIAAYFGCKLIFRLLNTYFSIHNNISLENVKNGVSLLFDFIIIDIKNQFVPEHKKKEYVESYNNKIDKFSEFINLENQD